MVSYLFLIPALPLAGAAVLLLTGGRLGKTAGAIASTLLGGSFAASLAVLGELIERGSDERLLKVVYEWISVGDLYVPVSLKVDALTAVMLMVITGVGTLIHVFSIGYMQDDPARAKFFGYLNLFAASMLILVMASNFVLMFVGWELVGLCSFLLISFWDTRPSAAAAGKKAFIVNRIGDFGFLIALFLIYSSFGTFDMDTVFSLVEVTPIGEGVTKAIPLLLLLGCTGKSAQIPLYVWLPDAMEGPTPVSALIHAATMVTAGVYLVARAHVLFEASPIAAQLVVLIGIATAFLAGLIAIGQDDIKRVLAYSTVSQLGYMFLAVGVGAMTGSALAYIAGIFHLVTHAFFKALLFLGSGSVMHALGDETDMKKMGGLVKVMPRTATTFIIGWLAISGIPPFAGFFSKESILAATWSGGLHFVWGAAVLVSGMTAFYMSRQTFLTFFGRPRYGPQIHPHEGPATMTNVLGALAGLAVAGGFINLTAEHGKLTEFLTPVFGESEHAIHSTPFGLAEPLAATLIVAVAALSIFTAYRLYLAAGAEERRERWKSHIKGIELAVRNKLYVDEAYNLLFVWPGRTVAAVLAFGFDVRVIDGAVGAVGNLVTRGGAFFRRSQTGQVRRYVMAMFAGAVLLFAFLAVRVR